MLSTTSPTKYLLIKTINKKKIFPLSAFDNFVFILSINFFII
jgi:hypothetical protein